MTDLANWGEIRNFSRDEFLCACCGVERMDHGYMLNLDELRDDLGYPIFINSGYRCPAHNQRVSKSGPDGPHTKGVTSDNSVASLPRYWDFLELLMTPKYRGYFPGLGIKLNGPVPGRFLHTDQLSRRIWTYG